MSDKNIRRAECAVCGGPRNCDVKAYYQQTESEEFITVWSDWYILQCRGCDYTFSQLSITNTEDYIQEEDGAGGYETVLVEDNRYWPSLSKRERPAWMSDGSLSLALKDTERDLVLILGETYTALDQDLPILAAIGIRTSFDVASATLGIDANLPFARKLEELSKQGFIRKHEESGLEQLIDAGNAATHRGWRPTAKDLEIYMEVLEAFINDSIISPAKAKERAERAKGTSVPPRKRKRDTKNATPSPGKEGGG